MRNGVEKIKPDIEIVQGCDYSYGGLMKGDAEVKVTINATDDADLTDKPVTAADFAVHMARLKAAPSFVGDRPNSEAESATYRNEKKNKEE